MSNSATFSYAQAAKGQSAVQSAGSQSSSTQSQAPSTTSTHSRDAAPTPSTRAPSVAISTTSNELDGSQNTGSSSVKAESLSLNSSDSDSISTSDKAGDSSNPPSQETEKVLGEVVPQSAERRGRGQTLTSQTTDTSDGKKGRKNKKSKGGEKESDQVQPQEKKENIPLKSELSEAPLPAVNIWKQRQEARAAQSKTVTSTTPQPRGSISEVASQPNGLPSQAAQDYKQRIHQNDGVDAGIAHNRPLPGGVKPSKKDHEQFRGNGNQASRRGGSRGARANNGEERPPFETLGPIANNTSSWPTPETAASGLKAQAQAGKSEKEQKEDVGPSKPRQKKEWQTIEFVPTVNFETPMPSRGSRGGRAGGPRGGRDGAVRGSHAASASIDRTHENGATAGNATAAPLASKRTSADMHSARDNRKPQTQTGPGKASGETPSGNPKGDALKQNSADMAHGAPSQHTSTRAVSSGQRTDETIKSPQSARDNTHGAKDSNFPAQNNSGRNERIRGGTRGRGGHSNMNGVAHSQSQFGQGSSRYNYPTTTNLQQPSQPYTNGYVQIPYGGTFPVQAAGSQHRSRPSSGNNRAQGGARHQPARAPAYPLGGVPYDAALYQHGGSQADYNALNALSAQILRQVEYYFSVENLCKDTYLRKMMDSQGFVPLGLIAGFYRMQKLTSDYQTVRMACHNSAHIELFMAEDGQDKVRRRENWEGWVLDINMRHPSAQNDGPTSYHPLNSQIPYWARGHPFGGEIPPPFSPTGMSYHYEPYVNGNNATSPTTNGVNGYTRPSDSQLSATVPEFSPIGNPGIGITGQQGETPSDGSGNEPTPDNTDKKTAIATFGEQVSPLANGTHAPGIAEHVSRDEKPSTNGIGASHETEAY